MVHECSARCHRYEDYLRPSRMGAADRQYDHVASNPIQIDQVWTLPDLRCRADSAYLEYEDIRTWHATEQTVTHLNKACIVSLVLSEEALPRIAV